MARPGVSRNPSPATHAPIRPAQRTSRAHPCPLCGRVGCVVWPDAQAAVWTKVLCRAEGFPGRVVYPDGVVPIREPEPVALRDEAPKAEPERLHRAYHALLRDDALALSERHRRDLARRGLDAAAVRAAGYATMPRGHRVDAVRRVAAQVALDGVPGVYTNANRHGEYPALAGAPGLLVPVRDEAGRVRGLQVRVDESGDGGRYRWVSSAGKLGGTGSGSPLGWTVGGDRAGELWVTEGVLKGEVAAHLSGRRFLCFAGAHAGQAAKVVEELRAVRWPADRPLVLAFDADFRENPAVRRALVALGNALAAGGFTPYVATWPAEAGKGLDDVLAAGHSDLVSVAPWSPRTFDGADLPKVRVAASPTRWAPPMYVSLAEAARQLEHRAERALRERDKPGVECVVTTAGAGKTFIYARTYGALLAKGRFPTSARLCFVVDTLAKAAEVHAEILATGAPASQVAPLVGRCEANCADLARVNTLGEKRHSPAKELCADCAEGGGCGYVVQRKAAKNANLVVATKAALLNEADDLGDFDLVVCDEDPVPHLVQSFDLTAEDLSAWADGLDRCGYAEDSPARRLVRVLQRALAAVRYEAGDRGPWARALPRLVAVAAAELGEDLAALVGECARMKRPRGGRFDFESPWRQDGTLRAHVPLRAFADLVRALDEELGGPRRDTRCWLVAEYPADCSGLCAGDPVGAHLTLVLPHRKVLAVLDKARVVILDATPDLRGLGWLFPGRVTVHQVAVREPVRVTQFTNALRQTEETRETVAEKVAEKVGGAHHVLRLGRKADLEGREETPDGFCFDWMGKGHKATNEYTGVRAVVVEAGYWSPPVDEVRALVEALRFDAPPPGRPPMYQPYVGTECEGLVAGAGVEADPDVAGWTAERWSADVHQAIGRARACRQKGTVEVFVEGRVPVAGLKIDTLTTAAEFLGRPALSDAQADALLAKRLGDQAEARARAGQALALWSAAHADALPPVALLAALAGCHRRVARAVLRHARGEAEFHPEGGPREFISTSSTGPVAHPADETTVALPRLREPFRSRVAACVAPLATLVGPRVGGPMPCGTNAGAAGGGVFRMNSPRQVFRCNPPPRPTPPIVYHDEVPDAPCELHEVHRGRRVEVVLAVVLRCPFCGRKHTHGAGVPGETPGFPLLGSRVAHCLHHRGEYRLVPADEGKEAQPCDR